MFSRSLLTTISASVLCLALAGCGTPPWQQGSTAATPASTPTATTGSASPTAKPVKVRNDLAKGSARHHLGAGGLEISVDYWSTLDMASWTSQATKPLNLSMTADFMDGSPQDIFLSSLTVTVDVRGPQGALSSPQPLMDRAPVTPGYLVTSPNAYVQVFNLPKVEDGASSLTLNLTYEVLAQSAPKSKKYLKQSTSDSLVIALAP